MSKRNINLSPRDDDPEWKKKTITPRSASCGLVESADRKNLILVERKHEPLGLAWPGGMIEIGETVEEAAIREIREETGVDSTVIGLLNVTSDPYHDPRWHVIIFHLIMRVADDKEPVGDDDALRAFWMPYDSDKYIDQLVVSTKQTLYDYREWRKKEGSLSFLR